MKILKKAAGVILGTVGAVVGFVVAGPAGAAIGFSLGMGIGSAIQMAAMKTKVPDVSSATNQRLNVSIDPDAFRTIAFGETALGTDQVYWETWGPESSYYDQVIAAAAHEIESFGDLYFDDELVTFSGDTATGAYAGALTKADRLVGITGTALTVGAGALWTSNCSLTGIAHYALRIRWSQEKYPRGIPSRVTRVGKGAKVYDPRRDSTVPGGSGSHRPFDQSTWEYAPVDSNGQPIGRNPALQILWYEIGWRVTNPSTSEAILVCGRGRPLDDIDFASFITAANDCEAEGYYSDVLLSTGDAHATNIAVLEAACAGKVMDTGGRISLRIRTDTTGDIVQAFTDGDVISTDAAVWRPSLPLSERWNQGRGSFVDPRALYRITPLPEPVRDAAYEAEDGFKRMGPQFRFDAVQDPDQVQNLIRLELNISRYMGVFTAPFNWRAKKVRIWDCVTLTFPRLGFDEKIFRVLEKKTDPMGAIWLLLREDDPSIYTPGTVNPVPAPSPGAGYDPRVVTAPDAGDWTVTPAYIEGGGAKIPTLLVSGEAPAPNIAAIHVEFRQGLSGDWIYEGRFTTFQAIRLDRASLAPGQPYYVRLSYENAYNVRSAWTQLGPYSAPADFTALSSLLSDAFVGQGALATEDQVTWATQVTGTGKPEDFATLSRVFRQDAAPSSPNTNDIWVQTLAGSPIAVRAWNGSAWVTGADITLINTAAAITGQDWGATASEAAASNGALPLRASIIRNSTFLTPFIGTVTPPNWSSWDNGVGVFGASVIGTGYTFRVVGLAGQNHGIQQTPAAVAGRKYIIAAEVIRRGGSFSGAGIYVSWRNSGGSEISNTSIAFATDPDTTGTISATPDGVVRYEKIVTAPAGTVSAIFYAMTHFSVFGSIAVENQIDWREASLSPITLVNETGADVTGNNPAAAIIGQGNQATASWLGSGNTASRPAPTGSYSTYQNTETGWNQRDVPSLGWVNDSPITSGSTPDDKAVSKSVTGDGATTAGSTWIEAAVATMTVGSAGNLSSPESILVADSVMTLSAGSVFNGEWRITEATQAAPSTKTVLWSGQFTATDTGGGLFDIVMTGQGTGGLRAATNGGACRYTLEIRRASGTNNVTGGGIDSFFNMIWTPAG